MLIDEPKRDADKAKPLDKTSRSIYEKFRQDRHGTLARRSEASPMLFQMYTGIYSLVGSLANQQIVRRQDLGIFLRQNIIQIFQKIIQ